MITGRNFLTLLTTLVGPIFFFYLFSLWPPLLFVNWITHSSSYLTIIWSVWRIPSFVWFSFILMLCFHCLLSHRSCLLSDLYLSAHMPLHRKYRFVFCASVLNFHQDYWYVYLRFNLFFTQYCVFMICVATWTCSFAATATQESVVYSTRWTSSSLHGNF